MKDLDWNMFAFLSWLERNKEAHTLDGLTIKDGYAWYNEQWKCWLKNSNTGIEMNKTTEMSNNKIADPYNDNRVYIDEVMLDIYVDMYLDHGHFDFNVPGLVVFEKDIASDVLYSFRMFLKNRDWVNEDNENNDVWRGNPDMMTWEEVMNGKLTVDTKTAGTCFLTPHLTDGLTGETTIQFPNPYQPEQYNPNKPSLDTMTFKFEQESNCVDGGEGETLIVEAKSSLGIDSDGGAFYVLKTEQWAISDIDEMLVMLKRVKAALDATKPTSIHVK
jgi:hypothetical protein